jgi:acetyl esterase/lipase
MRKAILYTWLMLGSFFIESTNAQQEKSSVYIHKESPSFKSQLFQKISSIFGAKKLIEKNILKNKINQKPAPIPKSIQNNYTVEELIVESRKVWILSPKKKHSKKAVLYLHGGAYYWGISKYNWSFAEELLKQTNTTLIIPDYPLAPNSTCENVYEFMEALYNELTLKYSSSSISIIGESAGGGLSLGFSMFLRDKNKPQPKQLILLAPWLDVTMSNPDILTIDKKDKILGIEGLKLAGKGYAGNLESTNYMVSPINGSLKELPQISLFIGTHDLFLADSRKLKEQANMEKVSLKYFEYPKMFHVWILLKNLKEATHAQQQITTLLLK